MPNRIHSRHIEKTMKLGIFFILMPIWISYVPQVSMALFLFLIGLLAIASFLYYHFYHKLRKLPPGPMPLPLIGNLMQMNQYESADQALLQWRRQYGPVFTYWLGNLPVVAIADYEKMVETVVKDADNYADRHNLPIEEEYRGRDLQGVLRSSGYRWREQRRFVLHVLRDFGLGKNLMQERILDEISAMVTKLNKKIASEPAKEISLSEPIDIAIGSIINNIVFGYRLDGEHEAEFWEIKRMLDEHMREFVKPLSMLWFVYNKVLDHVPPFKQIGHEFGQRLDHFNAFFEHKILEHQRELADKLNTDSEEEEPKDYVEAFLREMRRKQASGEQGHYFNINQLANTCFDLWIAGQETTANTLAWAFACLLNNPECLEKLTSELDTVLGGSDRLVNVTDKQSLPYINAVVNETLRFANLLPINLRRRLANDACVGGFQLPKGTCISPEIATVLIDDTIFPDPRVFRPERFLDKQGKLKRCDQLVPFSLGKRQCLGEPLARMELFLFIANICNQYKLIPGKELPSLKRHKGAIIHCPPFTCLMQKRIIRENDERKTFQ